ncbi:hypothetical protein GCM10011397_03190 [Wenyingzhuangia marina]|nr:hypothetical protein GCM10011397_03190 [Wenyingzhuangia marina]
MFKTVKDLVINNISTPLDDHKNIVVQFSIVKNKILIIRKDNEFTRIKEKNRE